MYAYELASNQSNDLTASEVTNDLIRAIRCHDEPVVILNNGNEAFIAMHPIVFERILMGSALLDGIDRKSMRL